MDLLKLAKNITQNIYDKDIYDLIQNTMIEDIIRKQPAKLVINKLQQISDFINITLNDNEMILQDDLWDKIYPSVWWQTFFPSIKAIREENKIEPVISGIISEILTPKMLQGILDNQENMIEPHKILIQNFIETYFISPGDELFPVNINMDAVYQKQGGVSLLSSTKQNRMVFLSSVFSGGGPMMLKMLQQIGTANSFELGNTGIRIDELVKRVFSDAPSMTKEQFQMTMKEIPFKDIKNLQDKSINSASIAEVHMASNGVLKVMKPIYIALFVCEVQFCLQTLWKKLGLLPDKNRVIQTRKILIFLVREFIKEFMYEDEAANTREGKKIYESKNIKSVAVIDSNELALFLSKAPGKPLAKVIQDIANLKDREKATKAANKIAKTMDQLSEIWIKSTFWGSGFFHADLHAGNIYCTQTASEIAELKDSELPEFTLLDYGSVGKMTKKEQCQMISAMVFSGKLVSLYQQPQGTKTWEKIHQQNLKVAQKFIDKFKDMCGIPKDVQGVQPSEIIDYSTPDGVLFHKVFLRIAVKIDDLGKCTNNTMMFFGRGIAYIASIYSALYVIDNTIPLIPLQEIFQKELMKSPLQALLFYTGKKKC